MSPPTSAAQPAGHAGRAVISTERRVQIWDQFYISFKETIPPYQWCTRQELVDAACSGETGVKFTVDELTEVIRGRKHKREAGIDSQKVNKEWLYRFIPPGSPTKHPSSKLLSASPPSAKAKRTPKAKARAKITPSKTTRPKSKAPARPRPKRPAAKTPPPKPVATETAAAGKEVPPSASRKRASPSPPTEDSTTRPRSALKKPRAASPRLADEGTPVESRQRVHQQGSGGDPEAAEGEGGGMLKFGGGAGVSAGGGEDGGRGWSCTVM
ncbi:unnamed protein product [Scytosiphon promiscuus]